MGSAEAAEMAKLAETTYRDVNIGLANQFAVYADKASIDVERVAEMLGSLEGQRVAVLGAAHRGGVKETARWAGVAPAGGGAPVV